MDSNTILFEDYQDYQKFKQFCAEKNEKEGNLGINAVEKYTPEWYESLRDVPVRKELKIPVRCNAENPVFFLPDTPFLPSEEISHIFSAAAYIGPLANELLSCRRRLTKFHARFPDPELRAIATKLSNLQVRAHAIFFILNSRFEVLSQKAQEDDTMNRQPPRNGCRLDPPSINAPVPHGLEIALNCDDNNTQEGVTTLCDDRRSPTQPPPVESVPFYPPLTNTALGNTLLGTDYENLDEPSVLQASFEQGTVNSRAQHSSAAERQGSEIHEGAFSGGRKSYRVNKRRDPRKEKTVVFPSQVPLPTPRPIGLQTSEYNPLLGKNVEETTLDGSLFPDVVTIPDFTEKLPRPLAFPISSRRTRKSNAAISRRRRQNTKNNSKRKR